MRDISLHILDIAENSVTAGASIISITINMCCKKDLLTICIEDNGRGMSEDMLACVKSPFTTSRTERSVGLGIPLFTASCENTGGSLDIESLPHIGTKLTAIYKYSHIDRPPLGDIAETIYTLTLMNPQIDFLLSAEKHTAFSFDTREIKKTLDGLAITDPRVLEFLRDYLHEGIAEVFGGKEL